MGKYWDSKIEKHTDWGGDDSTENKPVKGNRVQEFIRNALESKVGEFYYDVTNNRYLVFADAENRDKYLEDPVTYIGLLIGTFDAPFNYSASITLTSPIYNSILADRKDNYIRFTFDTFNKEGQSVGENVICTYTFIKSGTKKVITERYAYGQSINFKVDDYISVGTNTITVGISGQTTLAATTVGITYQVIDLKLSDTYNISKVYNLQETPDSFMAIPYSVSGYGIKIMEWYLDGVMLEYVKVEDEIVEISTTRTKYISLLNLSEGVHNVQYRTYTMINGEKFYSDILYRDIIVYRNLTDTIRIAFSATIPTGNDILKGGILKLFGITQYVPYKIYFATYNPNNIASTEVSINIENKAEANIITYNGAVNEYTIRTVEYGVKLLTLKSKDIILYSAQLNISKSSTSLEPIVDGLELDLTAFGKSNNDVNKEDWKFGKFVTTFSNFKWNKTSGWNDNKLYISEGAYIDINISPLTGDATNFGKTLEFEFSTSKVISDNAILCDLRDRYETGILITASSVILKSAGGATISTKFKSEEDIRVAFVINRKIGTAARGLIFIYINGILSGAANYDYSDNFASNVELRIGNTTSADIKLKALRFYNNALNSDQILNNYMLYRDDVSEMLSIYDSNNIYEEGTQNFSIDKIASKCPVFIFTGDIPTLENTTDKKKTIYVDIEYTNLQDTSRSFTGKGIKMTPQGTSSMGYPKKNFKIYTDSGDMFDSLGNIIDGGLYSFTDKAQPVACWCLKADYAESSGSHNTGVARLWNTCMMNAQLNGQYVLRTNAQKAAIAAKYEYDVRTTVDGFPCNVFYRLTANSELIYIGKYNFNNDKSTEGVFGFKDIPGFDNTRMQCWEILNNGNHLALFQDTINFDKEWEDAYESRYPDKSKNISDLKSFSEWVVSTKNQIEKFKLEKWNHLDVYKVAAYYVYLIRFGGVDQVIKNAMLTSEDGVHWYYINYDNDTVLSLRNDGLQIYNYDIDRQTIDTSFSALVYAYAGHESTLFNSLEADEEFMNIVSEIDNSLYSAGLSYESIIDMFDNKQSKKWCERIYNQDSQYKYIGPFTDSGINNLFMLQGSRTSHRRWWVSRRFDLYDSKFVSGAYKSKSIEWKAANTPIGLKFSITAGRDLYYGYGLNNVPIEKGIHLLPNENHEFTTKQVINVGDPVRLYAGVNIKGIYLKDFARYISVLNISEAYDPVLGTNLKALHLGGSSAVKNTSLNSISGINKAILLESIDIAGFVAITTLDISNLLYLQVFIADDSGLTSFAPANGCPISWVKLPDSLQTLTLDSLPNIGKDSMDTAFEIQNSGRHLTNIFIKNCPNFDTKAFIYNWLNVALNLAGSTVVLENILWKAVTPVELIRLGEVKADGTSITLKGRIEVTSVNPEQLETILYYFGSECTSPDNELYIKFPESIFLDGLRTLTEGDGFTYHAIVISEYKGTVEYFIENDTPDNGATIDVSSGLLLTTEIGRTRIITIRAKHTNTKDEIFFVDINVTIEKIVYPDRMVISGNKFINKLGNYEYKIEVSNSLGETINGAYEIIHNVDYIGDIDIRLGTHDNSGFILNVLKLAIDHQCEILSTLKKRNGDQAAILSVSTILDVTVEGVIMTKRSNAPVLDVLFKAGKCASSEYMLQTEAEAVYNLPQFSNNRDIVSFDELRFFTSITEIPLYCFNSCYIQSIIFPNSIKRVASSAFESAYLNNIVLNDGLVTIEERAFRTTNLANIDIPDSVTTIHAMAFNNCYQLVTINISKTSKLNFIGGDAFRNCSSLEEIYLLNIGVTTNLFMSCHKLKNIIVNPENLNCSVVDGVLYNKDKTRLITFPNARGIENYTLLETVEVIGPVAFYDNTTIKTIQFHNNLKHILEESFKNSAITEITIPSKVRLSDSTFNSCNQLVSVILEEGFTRITGRCFAHCIKLNSIVLPNSLINISSSGFYGCSSLESIDIPASVETIENNAFYGTTKLKTVNLVEGSLRRIGSYSFSASIITSIVIPSKVVLDMYAFDTCAKLETVVLPNDIVVICGFRNCVSLKTILIPDSATHISQFAFRSCNSLVEFDTGNNVHTIHYEAFDLADIGKLTISDKVTSVEFLKYQYYTHTIFCKCLIAPVTTVDTFKNIGSSTTETKMLYVPVGATGYDVGGWKDYLCDPTKGGFTISYTL